LITYSKDYYPTSEEMSAEKALAFVPESLCILLQTLFPANSSTSLGQAITQAPLFNVLCSVKLYHFYPDF